MLGRNVTACTVAFALALLSAPALAQTNQQLEEIRKQIQELRDSYDSRIQALEKQLKEAEEAAAKAQAAATQAQSAAGQAKQSAESAAQASAPKQPASPSAFNPGLSLILMGGYYNSDQDPRTRSVTGFLGPDEYGLPNRGFDLGETERRLRIERLAERVAGHDVFAWLDDEIAAIELAHVAATAGSAVAG